MKILQVTIIASIIITISFSLLSMPLIAEKRRISSAVAEHPGCTKDAVITTDDLILQEAEKSFAALVAKYYRCKLGGYGVTYNHGVSIGIASKNCRISIPDKCQRPVFQYFIAVAHTEYLSSVKETTGKK